MQVVIRIPHRIAQVNANIPRNSVFLIHLHPVFYSKKIAACTAASVGRYNFSGERNTAVYYFHRFAAKYGAGHAANLPAKNTVRKDTLGGPSAKNNRGAHGM